MLQELESLPFCQTWKKSKMIDRDGIEKKGGKKKELKQKRIEKREIKVQMEKGSKSPNGKGSKSPNKKRGLKVQIEIGKSK